MHMTFIYKLILKVILLLILLNTVAMSLCPSRATIIILPQMWSECVQKRTFLLAANFAHSLVGYK